MHLRTFVVRAVRYIEYEYEVTCEDDQTAINAIKKANPTGEEGHHVKYNYLKDIYILKELEDK